MMCHFLELFSTPTMLFCVSMCELGGSVETGQALLELGLQAAASVLSFQSVGLVDRIQSSSDLAKTESSHRCSLLFLSYFMCMGALSA